MAEPAPKTPKLPRRAVKRPRKVPHVLLPPVPEALPPREEDIPTDVEDAPGASQSGHDQILDRLCDPLGLESPTFLSPEVERRLMSFQHEVISYVTQELDQLVLRFPTILAALGIQVPATQRLSRPGMPATLFTESQASEPRPPRRTDHSQMAYLSQ